MLKCRAATRLLSEALERKLSLGERLNLGIHTIECQNCRNFGRQIKAMRSLSRAYAEGASVDSAEPDETGNPPEQDRRD